MSVVCYERHSVQQQDLILGWDEAAQSEIRSWGRDASKYNYSVILHQIKKEGMLNGYSNASRFKKKKSLELED